MQIIEICITRPGVRTTIRAYVHARWNCIIRGTHTGQLKKKKQNKKCLKKYTIRFNTRAGGGFRVRSVIKRVNAVTSRVFRGLSIGTNNTAASCTRLADRVESIQLNQYPGTRRSGKKRKKIGKNKKMQFRFAYAIRAPAAHYGHDIFIATTPSKKPVPNRVRNTFFPGDVRHSEIVFFFF